MLKDHVFTLFYVIALLVQLLFGFQIVPAYSHFYRVLFSRWSAELFSEENIVELF